MSRSHPIVRVLGVTTQVMPQPMGVCAAFRAGVCAFAATAD